MYIHFLFCIFHLCLISPKVHSYFFTCTFYISHFTFFSPVLLLLSQTQTTPKKGRDITADILDPVLQPDPALITRAFWRQNTLIHFISKCSAPLYSWSGSLTGSDYFSLYISLCFRLNKSLTNLTLLRQHHLQYRWNKVT